MDMYLVLKIVGVTILISFIMFFSLLVTSVYFKIKKNIDEIIHRLDAFELMIQSFFPPISDQEMSEMLKRALSPDIFTNKPPDGHGKIIFKSSDGKYTANSPEELLDKINQDINNLMKNKEDGGDEEEDEERPSLTQEETDRLKNYFTDMIDRELKRQKDEETEEDD